MACAGGEGDKGRIEGEVFRGEVEGGGEVFCGSFKYCNQQRWQDGGVWGRGGARGAGHGTRDVAYSEGL